MGRWDDESILPSWTLARGVRLDWLDTERDGSQAVQSRAFEESNQEVSCFILEETGGIDGFRKDILPIIENELGRQLKIATIGVEFVRLSGFWIFRKPEEFHNNPAHVVLCPSQVENIPRSAFKKQAREIAKHALLHPG
jgi:hypothetical protein